MLSHVVRILGITRLAFNHLCAMNTEDVLRRLQSRAVEAESLVESLKSQITALKRASTDASTFKECDDLILENEKLDKEIDFWKRRLIEAEVENGRTPVQIIASVTVPKTEKPESNCKAAEPRVNGEKSDEIKTDSPVAASSKKSTTEQEKLKRKSVDKKPKQDVKKDSGTDKSDDRIDVGRLDIRIGRVVEVKKHPDADSLYVESIDLGEEKERTVVSGLVRFVERQELEGRLVALLCNLKPAKMRGVTSEAMVLCASTPEKVEVLSPPSGSTPGDVVICEGYPLRPDPVLNPKKKVWETVATDLKVNSSGVATYKGVPLTVSGKGEIRSTTLIDVPIK